MIVVFDLGGPLLVHGLLGALVDRRPDVIGVMVLGGIAVGTILGLTTHSARRTVRTSG